MTSKPSVLLDTNIVIDYLSKRIPFFESARRLMALGKLGEVRLWIAASQFTDIIYVLTNGGNASCLSDVLRRLRRLRTFVSVATVNDEAIDRMLVTEWGDAEDALLFEIATILSVDAVISRNKKDFESSALKVCDCDEFFTWLSSECDVKYGFISLE